MSILNYLTNITKGRRKACMHLDTSSICMPTQLGPRWKCRWQHSSLPGGLSATAAPAAALARSRTDLGHYPGEKGKGKIPPPPPPPAAWGKKWWKWWLIQNGLFQCHIWPADIICIDGYWIYSPKMRVSINVHIYILESVGSCWGKQRLKALSPPSGLHPPLLLWRPCLICSSSLGEDQFSLKNLSPTCGIQILWTQGLLEEICKPAQDFLKIRNNAAS